MAREPTEPAPDLELPAADLRQEVAALRQQAAALGEILRIINASPGDPQLVFDAVLEHAMRLCGAAFGELAVLDGQRWGVGAQRGVPPALVEFRRQRLATIDPNAIRSRILAGENLILIADARDTAEYRAGHVSRRAMVDLGGARSIIAVALRHDGQLRGLLSIYRQEVRPFDAEQIALLQNFAAQAVIAMENARLITEQREALEQQTATAEVLGVINASPGDLSPVFAAILQKAHAVCGAEVGSLGSWDGTHFRTLARHGYKQETDSWLERPWVPLPNHAPLLRGEVLHYPDTAVEPSQEEDAVARAWFAEAGLRTFLMVPLRKDGGVIGFISAFRRAPRAFNAREIALLESFAAQAVIAMENARLITEQREALERQTATSEVLAVINTSPGNLAPVFDALLERAMRHCGAHFGSLYTYDGARYQSAAQRGVPEAYAAFRAKRPPDGTARAEATRTRETRKTVHILDMSQEPAYLDGHPGIRAMVDLGGARTVLAVPLLKDDTYIGYVSIYRQEVRPFADKQIALLENFAAQAVIAMENARLITETREALERQTATSEVLATINASPGDLAPVFDAILEKGLRLIDAAFGGLFINEGENIRVAATRGMTPALAKFRAENPVVENPPSARQAYATRRSVQQLDNRESAGYRAGLPGPRAVVDLGGARSMLVVPLLTEADALGAIQVYRQEVRAFTEQQVALLENFAAQAVIAMENARLITEQREALERQTATAEVLGVINASAGELAPVFEAMLEKACRLCEADSGAFWLTEGDMVRAVATRGYGPAVREYITTPHRTDPDTGIGRILHSGLDVAHIPDLSKGPAYQAGDRMHRLAVDEEGIRSTVAVPLRKDDVVLGVFGLTRRAARPFTEHQISVLQNFAAQAVIAMENARLITEQREALEQQTATAEVLGVINANPGNLAPVFDAVLERALRLSGATFGSFLTYDGERMHMATERGVPVALSERRRQNPSYVPGPGSPMRRLIETKRRIMTPDLLEDAHYKSGSAIMRDLVELGGVRAALSVPLLKDDGLLGNITIYRDAPGVLPDKQISLLENFAAQAVIAMENARLIIEQREALERQTATADILSVISTSLGDVQPVFDKILESCKEIFRGDLLSLSRVDEQGQLQLAAYLGALREEVAATFPAPVELTPAGAAIREGRVMHYSDILHNPETPPVLRHIGQIGGIHSMIFAPLMWQGRGIGAVGVARASGAFTDREIEVLQTFAAQAVIAVENARLLGELRERTEALASRNSEYGERIEQQSATIDVLKEMSASPDDAQPVFDLIARRAREVCGTPNGAVFTYDGTLVHLRATSGMEAYMRESGFASYRALFPMLPTRGSISCRAILDGQIVHVRDVQLDAEAMASVRAIGHRSQITVPMLRDGRAVGAISLSSPQTGGFMDSQVALLQTFAEQAVIAITSAETFSALRERTEALAARNSEYGERIEQQSATIDVLKVMSASPGDPQPVFELIAERARLFSQSDAVVVIQVIDGIQHLRAYSGSIQRAEAAYVANFPRPIDETNPIGQAVLARRTIEIENLQVETQSRMSGVVVAMDLRAVIAIPMLRGTEAIGGIGIGRAAAGKFSPTQIELLQTFAEQAVIAITSAENYRALTERTAELTRSVAELQALEETIRSVNSSLDLDVVLATIISRAVQLSQADEGTIYEYSEQEQYFIPKAAHGMSAERVEALRERRIRMGETHLGRSAVARAPVHVSDVQQDASMQGVGDLLEGIHAVLAVPLLRDDKVIGGLVIRRRTAGDFAPSIPTLLQTFAGQSVLAIENARLFEQLTERGEEASRARLAAEAALEDLRRAQDRLVQAEKMASLGQLTAGIAHEIKNPLNFVNNFSDVSTELLDELGQVLDQGAAGLAPELRAEIDELSGMLKGNLQKIIEHGKRADSIVKNMLAHSRTGASERRAVDFNSLAEEALNLAYHGARAEIPGFNITMEKDLDPAAGQVELYPQEFTRVLLNLVSNGFYATRKRAEIAGAGYVPTLRLSTRMADGQVEVRVRDNGTGMPAAVREKIFEPFFTTKPAGEGTGLGLSLSFDIVVKQHGGQLTVMSEEGSFTEFRIILPRALPAAPGENGGVP